MDDPISFRSAALSFVDFFHAPASPLPLAVFRIAFGIVLLIESLGLLRWGPHLFANAELRGGAGPLDSKRIAWLFRIHTLSCVCLALGLFTRIAAALVFLNFCFRSRRNWLVIQGGDNFAKFMSLLLIFSNAGGVLSIDHLLRLRWLGGAPEAASQWPMRLMQIQVSMVYLRTVCWKLQISQWMDGSAVFHSLYRNRSLRQLFRREVVQSLLARAPVTAFLTWSILAAETFIGIFLWFRETRIAALVVAVALHVALELGLSIKYFQWLMLTSLVLFVSPAEWEYLRTLVAAAM
jgi:uncharacterized membrane protein YphA (DoxX/SURF4 family)